VACSGVHGANRLASNSLLEGLVFGMRAGVAATAFAQRHGQLDLAAQAKALACEDELRLEDAEKLRSSLRRTMWGQVGVIRSRESLVRATAQLSRWLKVVSGPFISRADLEVKNMVQVAHCVAEAALWRENSIGAHFRSDFPQVKRAGWKLHSQLTYTDELTQPKPGRKQGMVIAMQVGSKRSRARLTPGLS